MSIKLNYLKKTINKPTGNIVLFTNEKFKTNELKKYLSNSEIYNRDTVFVFNSYASYQCDYDNLDNLQLSSH